EKRIPDNGTLRMDLGLALLKAGDERGAKREFEESLRLNPGLTQSLSNLGMIEFDAGQREPGLQKLRKAVDLDPTVALMHERLAYALALSKNYAGALSEARQMVRLDRRN